jgi:hypothetical protein
MQLVSDVQFLMICLLYVYVYEFDFFPVMFAAVIETGNKIVIGVTDTGEFFDASVNDTGHHTRIIHTLLLIGDQPGVVISLL